MGKVILIEQPEFVVTGYPETPAPEEEVDVRPFLRLQALAKNPRPNRDRQEVA